MMSRFTFWRRLWGEVNVSQLPAKEFGAWAEKQADRFLRRKGMTRMARNFRSGRGEVDLIVRDGDMIVFVEVKAVRNQTGEPELKVDRGKRRRLTSAAKGFINRHNLHECPARFDIVTVKLDPANRPVIEHEPDAFQAEEND
jgi:putative endonuclease